MAPQTGSGSPTCPSVDPDGRQGVARAKDRKRVPRACDNCRIRKSKCDSLRPCGICSLHQVDCSYDAARKTNRRDLTYILDLERTVRHLTESLEQEERKKTVTPSSQPLPEPASEPTSSPTADASDRSADDDGLLETMIKSTGELTIDDFGNYEYHGNSSGLSVLQRIRELCSALVANHRHDPREQSSLSLADFCTQPFALPIQPSQLPQTGPPPNILPDKATALSLVSLAFDEAFSLLHFIDQAEFNSDLERVYSALSTGHGVLDMRFVALLYEVLAVGEFYSAHLVHEDEVAVEGSAIQQKAKQYFLAGQRMLDLVDCRDVTSVQAIMCIIIYLQSSAMISTCYSYISLALTACIRMGLHSSATLQMLGPEEQEKRKRIFWVLRTMDSYVTTTLGLPRTICSKYVNQGLPAYMDVTAASPGSDVSFSLNAVNDHVKLMLILDKVREYVHGGVTSEAPQGGCYYVHYARITEVERDLEEWCCQLPPPAEAVPVSKQFEKEQLLLRLFQAHVQMALYRPLLHHITKKKHNPDFEFHAYACASSCIRASMQVIWLDKALKARGYLNGNYWFTVYTNFFAIVCLTMFALGNEEDPTAQEAISTAIDGYEILKEMSRYNVVAGRCVECLKFISLEERAASLLFSTKETQPSAASCIATHHRAQPIVKVMFEKGTRGRQSYLDAVDSLNLAPYSEHVRPMDSLNPDANGSSLHDADFQLPAGIIPALNSQSNLFVDSVAGLNCLPIIH